jgi:16S rRNA C967 or C1407 C5-methylase (RsmB/RsmF family)
MKASTKKNRLEHLQKFQLTALKKAMTLPNIELIVYSTCSVNVEENEAVRTPSVIHC